MICFKEINLFPKLWPTYAVFPPFLFILKNIYIPCLLLNYWLTSTNVIFFLQCSGHKRIRKISDGPCFATSEGFRQINNVKGLSLWPHRLVFKTIGGATRHLSPHTTVWMWTWAIFTWYYFLPDGQAKAGQRVGEIGGGGGDRCQQVGGRKGKGQKTKTKPQWGKGEGKQNWDGYGKRKQGRKSLRSCGNKNSWKQNTASLPPGEV